MPKFDKSIDYIKDFIQSLVKTNIHIGNSNNYLISFTLEEPNIQIVFNRSQLDDLEQYLDLNNINSDQFRGFWGDLKFHIYVTLGKAGLIPSFDIVREILKEKEEIGSKGLSLILMAKNGFLIIFIKGLPN